MHLLEQKLRQAGKEGREALIPFVTAGFPTPERFWNVIDELDANGADIIEIGVPFSDPMADGPVVEAASVRALASGVSLDGILNALAERAAAGGVQGCIVPDLPLEESGPLREALKRRDIALIPLVGSNTPLERMREYGACAEGYVYVVSVLGVTGERKGLPAEVTDTLRRARQAFGVPVALGFGLREPAQLAGVPADAKPDAVIFGSALLRHLDNGGTPAEFMNVWR